MMTRIATIAAAAALAVGLGTVQPASAAAIYVFREAAGNVVGQLTGSIDTTGAEGFPQMATFDGPGFGPTGPNFGTGSNNNQEVTLYTATNPGPFGTSLTANISFVQGTFLAVIGPSVTLLTSYVSGSEMEGLMIFNNTTLADLGVTLGRHVWTLTNGDTFALQFTLGATEVPAPASLPVLAGALGMLGLAGLARRRR